MCMRACAHVSDWKPRLRLRISHRLVCQRKRKPTHLPHFDQLCSFAQRTGDIAWTRARARIVGSSVGTRKGALGSWIWNASQESVQPYSWPPWWQWSFMVSLPWREVSVQQSAQLHLHQRTDAGRRDSGRQQQRLLDGSTQPGSPQSTRQYAIPTNPWIWTDDTWQCRTWSQRHVPLPFFAWINGQSRRLEPHGRL